MTTVSITDDHKIVLSGLANLLRQEEHIEVLGVHTSAAETTEALKTVQPQILLLDIHLGDGNGVDLCAVYHGLYPKLKIIALTTYNQVGLVKRFMKNGGAGYLLKSTSKDELLEAFETVQRGETYLHPEIKAMLLNESIGNHTSQSYIPVLTRREKEVLLLIVDEKTTSEIAELLFVSPKTVETHRTHLMQKLGVKNIAGLVKEAIYKGLLD